VYDSLGDLRDSLSVVRGEIMHALTGRGASLEEIASKTAAIDTTLRAVNGRLSRFFLDHPMRGKVGAFEGAAYLPRGFYRPTVNSLMNVFNSEERTYYPVNERAIVRMIDFFSE
jgi:hypothetical protein